MLCTDSLPPFSVLLCGRGPSNPREIKPQIDLIVLQLHPRIDAAASAIVQAAPAIQLSLIHIYSAQGRIISRLRKGMYRLGLRNPSQRNSRVNTSAAASCSRNFCGAVSPVFWWCFTFS